jgi:endonuclease YncB( thermonuclease family)
MYGRIVGTAYITSGLLKIKDDISVNEIMVRDGYAWWFKNYSKKYWFGKLECEAQEFKKGIWNENNNIPPWKFRKNKRSK